MRVLQYIISIMHKILTENIQYLPQIFYLEFMSLSFQAEIFI